MSVEIMINVIPFQFEKNSVRAIQLDDSEPWFVAKDVAEALGYSWRGLSGTMPHIPSEWRGVRSIQTPSGYQDVGVISEQGLYFFLGRSDKKSALPFQKMVAGEVMPAIRKTGRYESKPNQLPAIPQNFAQALRLAADQAEVIEQQAAQLASAKPAIEFHDAVANLDGTCMIGHIAKTLGHGPNKLFARLKADGILMASRMPYQKYVNAGYFEVREGDPYKNSKEESCPTFTTVVTGKGQIWLARKYPAGMDLSLKVAA